jgi:hypothetical protein
MHPQRALVGGSPQGGLCLLAIRRRRGLRMSAESGVVGWGGILDCGYVLVCRLGLSGVG